MASPISEFNYSCKLCPRTFKLQEFYDKHQKVHQLKKQHVCKVCGFVYGAAKGLEGHMDSAHPEPIPPTHSTTPPVVRRIEQPEDLSPQIPEMPFFHFLQAQGLLTSNEVYKQAQQAMMAQMTNTTKNLQLVPISITAPASPSPTGSLSQKPNDKSKIPSPAGTGNYKIYDQVPEIQDASDAQQNDSGFFRCTICTREFSGLNSLKKHVPIHTRRVQHKCDTCGYVFGKKEYLLDHMRKHSGELSPVCEVCGQTFNKSLKLKEHQKLHRNTEKDGSTHQYSPYRCHICKQCFSRPDPLGDHLRTAHSETVYKCDMCDATFGDVRGKNHHMYNEHQLDAFHQKCVWCPVCNQGFTRHYNLKVHMYKSHGKEYLENNFSQEELDNLMRPPPGSNTSSPTSGVLPISPPLTPKLSPKLRTAPSARGEDSPTLVPSSSCIPSALSLKENNKENNVNNNNNNNNNSVKRSRPGPASLTKPQHYFDQEAQHAIIKCQLCEEKFLRKSDLFIHLKQHEERFHEISDLKKQDEVEPRGQKRRPGPASRTNAPREQRAVPSNLPTHLANHCPESPGYPCQQCGKVLMHKQSYVSHMRVIHGDYYGGNKWKGSSVVEMVLGNKAPQSNNNTESQPRDYSDYQKFGQTCEFCNKAFSDPSQLDEHMATKHPNLTRRIQAFKAALGLKDSEQEPDTKRFKLDYKEVHKRETDELTNNNNNNNNENNNNNIKMEPEAESFQQKVTIQEKKTITLEEKREEIKMMQQSNNNHVQEVEDEDADEEEDVQVEDEYEGDEERFPVKDRSDDVRYEAIEEEFEFSGEKIKPCYCVLPFVSDEEVEGMTKRNIAEYYEQPEEYSEDEEGEMVIDENPPPESPVDLACRTPPQASPSPRPTVTSNYNNNELKVNNFGQSFADAINICRKESLTAPSSLQNNNNNNKGRLPQAEQATHTVKFEPQQSALLYPSFPDFSLPFSLSGLIQKKKAEMAAILAPRMSPKPTDTSRLTLDHLSKAAMAVKPPVSPATSHKSHSSSHGGDSTTNTAVSEYENQIQNDLWPIDCIKCTSVLTNLDNFNVHMNDHWSDDKCCPVCGLLINSKRFNFKQHLKIHTGEKPFVCQVCNRAFRQKAHMVKHVTTHRTEPRAVPESLLAYQTENGAYQPGVIVQ